MKNSLILLLISILLFSCKKDNPPKKSSPIIFNNVVILGNSITYAPGTKGTEWEGSWGMAASAPEFDYVHLLTNDFSQTNKSSVVNIRNIAAFERGFEEYDFDTNLKDLKDSRPDLLILRIGENITFTETNKDAFTKRYQELISYFKSNNPHIHILGVGSIWGNETADNIMSKESDFLTLHTLDADPTNYAYGNFVDGGIAHHPSDKGMKAIAGLIWEKLQLLK